MKEPLIQLPAPSETPTSETPTSFCSSFHEYAYIWCVVYDRLDSWGVPPIAPLREAAPYGHINKTTIMMMNSSSSASYLVSTSAAASRFLRISASPSPLIVPFSLCSCFFPKITALPESDQPQAKILKIRTNWKQTKTKRQQNTRNKSDQKQNENGIHKTKAKHTPKAKDTRRKRKTQNESERHEKKGENTKRKPKKRNESCKHETKANRSETKAEHTKRKPTEVKRKQTEAQQSLTPSPSYERAQHRNARWHFTCGAYIVYSQASKSWYWARIYRNVIGVRV
jgi:outer membrane biosynthesis protein TonB